MSQCPITARITYAKRNGNLAADTARLEAVRAKALALIHKRRRELHDRCGCVSIPAVNGKLNGLEEEGNYE